MVFGCRFLVRRSAEVAARIAAVKAKVKPGLVGPDLAAVKAELADLEAEVEWLDAWKQSLPELRRLVGFFAFEIRLSGADPDGLKRSLMALG